MPLEYVPQQFTTPLHFIQLQSLIDFLKFTRQNILVQRHMKDQQKETQIGGEVTKSAEQNTEKMYDIHNYEIPFHLRIQPRQ